ncbi:MAG: hypothetical protein C1943_03840 [Halochromatium sp.]|nr:hypothetical protein [Halochromatium sp.]
MSELPKAPSYLSLEAKREFKRIAALLQRRGLYDELRLASLTAYAVAAGRVESLEKQLAKATDQAEIDKLLHQSGQAQRHMRNHARDLGLPAQTKVEKKDRLLLREEKPSANSEHLNQLFDDMNPDDLRVQ